jgi:hypothetical protein
MNKKIAIIFIGTGKYINFFPRYYRTFMEYFVPECWKDFYVFTDGELSEFSYSNVHLVSSKDTFDFPSTGYSPENWDYLMHQSIGGLGRFNQIKRIKSQLSYYDWMVYLDADMYCCPKLISYQEFFDDSKSFFGIQHPTRSPYFKKFDGDLPFERNLVSSACVSEEMQLDEVYLQGCVWGGKIPNVFELVDELDTRIKSDLSNNIRAIAHDESHLNRYRMENIDKFRVLPSYFAKPGNIPDDEFISPARMIHSPADKPKILEC